MKGLEEFIIDEKFEKYLFDDLKLFLTCNINESRYFGINFDLPFIFESENLFQNYEFIVGKIFGEVLKASREFKDIVNISLKMVQSYPKEVEFKLTYNDLESVVKGHFTKLENNVVHGILELPDDSFAVRNQLKSIILHELLHGYEEFLRKEKNLPSIFDDFKDAYSNAFQNIIYPRKQDEKFSKEDQQKTFVTKYIGVTKYFFNEHEIWAYMPMLEFKLKNILKNLKPNYNDLKYEDCVKLLKKEYVWKTYFEFGKFILIIDKIEDKLLEDIYTEICESKESFIKRTNDRIELVKQCKKSRNKIPPKERYIEKSAEDIRKECKEVWYNFKTEFDTEFTRIYDEILYKNQPKVFY